MPKPTTATDVALHLYFDPGDDDGMFKTNAENSDSFVWYYNINGAWTSSGDNAESTSGATAAGKNFYISVSDVSQTVSSVQFFVVFGRSNKGNAPRNASPSWSNARPVCAFVSPGTATASYAWNFGPLPITNYGKFEFTVVLRATLATGVTVDVSADPELDVGMN
ncbi:MAG TPA: hypothetical protein DEH78_05405 [Solibacterales bacterium]|nr:hypothetical protein [Bryobacterales bacterium]